MKKKGISCHQNEYHLHLITHWLMIVWAIWRTHLNDFSSSNLLSECKLCTYTKTGMNWCEPGELFSNSDGSTWSHSGVRWCFFNVKESRKSGPLNEKWSAVGFNDEESGTNTGSTLFVHGGHFSNVASYLEVYCHASEVYKFSIPACSKWSRLV